jgi:hypothetical protein
MKLPGPRKTRLARRPLTVTAVAMMWVLIVSGLSSAAEEIPVLTSRAGEFQPARGPNHLAWEQNTKATPRRFDVLVREDGGDPVRVNRPRWNGALGGIDDDLLVYQEFRVRKGKRLSDIRFLDLNTGAWFNPPRGVNKRPHWEYWPSVSRPWLLFGRLLRNDTRRLLLRNLETGETRTLDRTRAEKPFIAPGQVNGDYAVWSKCTDDNQCQVYLHHIPTGTTSWVPNPGAHQEAPSVTPDGTVYMRRGGRGCGADVSLVRYPIGGPETVLVELPGGLDIDDSFAYVEPNGAVEVHYDRIGCGRRTAGDIYKVQDVTMGTLRVVKDSTSPGTFTFTLNGEDFVLDTDPNTARPNERTFEKPPGTYTVQEDDPSPSALTGLSCDDSDGETTWDLDDRTATVDLDPGETVTCTFTNTP